MLALRGRAPPWMKTRECPRPIETIDMGSLAEECKHAFSSVLSAVDFSSVFHQRISHPGGENGN